MRVAGKRCFGTFRFVCEPLRRRHTLRIKVGFDCNVRFHATADLRVLRRRRQRRTGSRFGVAPEHEAVGD